MRLSVGRGPLTTPVLVRSVGAFAARTSLPVDRINDIAGHPGGDGRLPAR